MEASLLFSKIGYQLGRIAAPVWQPGKFIWWSERGGRSDISRWFRV
jgi:hypothetical protein